MPAIITSILAAITVLFFLPLPLHGASCMKAELYALEKDSSRPKFFFNSKQTESGDIIVRYNEFTDEAGKLVATEKIEFNKGQLTYYKLEHLQREAVTEVKRHRGLLQVKHQDNKGKERDDEFATDKDLILPPQLIDKVVSSLKEVKEGRSVEFRLLIPDLFQVVTFTAKKVESKRAGLRVRIRPAYAYIALFVDPLYFSFNSNGKVETIEGQTLLLDERKKDFKAQTRISQTECL